MTSQGSEKGKVQPSARDPGLAVWAFWVIWPLGVMTAGLRVRALLRTEGWLEDCVCGWGLRPRLEFGSGS